MQHYNRNVLKNHDVHQIYTYVSNLDVRHEGRVDGMLLYAKTEDSDAPDDMIKLNDGNIIMFRTLDLNQDFSVIKAQLERFIKYNVLW